MEDRWNIVDAAAKGRMLDDVNQYYSLAMLETSMGYMLKQFSATGMRDEFDSSCIGHIAKGLKKCRYVLN